MKKLVFNSGEQNKNESSSIFNFPVENKMEILNNYELNHIKGGNGEGEKNIDQEWED